MDFSNKTEKIGNTFVMYNLLTLFKPHFLILMKINAILREYETR